MHHQEIIRDWRDVERWLLCQARACVRQRQLPPTLAIAFHAGRTSMLIAPPPFCLEDADAVTDVLCRVLPGLLADQILVLLPGCFVLDEHGDEELFALRALLGVRDEGWRHLVHPLCFDRPPEEVTAFEVEPTDPWTARIRQVFDPATADLPFVSSTPPADDDILIAVPPDSPLADATDALGAG